MLHVLGVLVFLIILKCFNSQEFVGDNCIVKSTNSPGICKLLDDCAPALQELQNHHRFPQRCGFQGLQPIVCCPPPERKPGEVSKQKCNEYSAYVKEKKQSPILLIDPPTITRDECGHKVVKLIVGGKPAGRKEFPHMAAIGYDEEGSGQIRWLCGGTIVSEKFILTAAHCLSDYAWGDAKWVKVGVTDLNDARRKQEIKVIRLIPYPEYRSSSHYHDIGLLELETLIQLNPFARPACLYLKPEIDAKKAIATGWGHTSWGGSGSNILLKVTIDLFDHDFCNASYRNQIGRRLVRGIVNELQVCAGSETEEKDTCQGDSGGPLQIYHIGDDIKCMYDVVGITSFGKACSGSPGVYVRVSYYIKWIEDQIWPQT